MPKPHFELHYADRIGWLRAAVMGANDGIVSTASLVVGVTAANAAREDVLIAGVAGLVAGAMSMAAGEYVSVSSQADTEKADLERERKELETDGQFERKELAAIYVKRGLDSNLADQVAEQLMAKDALAAHARDELGISETISARPVQAALTSAVTFAVGADGAVVGTTNLHIYAAMRGQSLEDFQKTRNAQVLYSVAGQDAGKKDWDKNQSTPR